jgi:hypothetical protein
VASAGQGDAVRDPNRWFDRFQLGPRSRRIINEALADWRHDVASATTGSAVVFAHFEGVLSLGRLCGTVVAESLAPAFHPSWLMTLAVCVALVSLISGSRPSNIVILSARIAVPMAVLFGPSRLRSPFLALTVLQIVASIGIAVDHWWLSRALMVQATAGCVLGAAVADRIRMDAHRERRTVQLAFLLVPIWYIGFEVASILRAAGVSPTTVERVLWTWLMACLVSMWCWLVRRQETRIWWSQVRRWLEYRAETRS